MRILLLNFVHAIPTFASTSSLEAAKPSPKVVTVEKLSADISPATASNPPGATPSFDIAGTIVQDGTNVYIKIVWQNDKLNTANAQTSPQAAIAEAAPQQAAPQQLLSNANAPTMQPFPPFGIHLDI